jgi:hypothetical protein
LTYSNEELRRVWREAVMACFTVLFWYLLGVTERERRNLRIVGVLAEIRTGHLV